MSYKRNNKNRMKNSKNHKNKKTSGNSKRNNMDRPKTIRVFDLNPMIISTTALEYFKKMETIKTNGNGTAASGFRRPRLDPKKFTTDGHRKIDGRRVRIDFIRNEVSGSHQIRWEGNMLYPLSFSMSFRRTQKKFTDGWTSTDRDLRLELNHTMRGINIFFSHLGQKYKVEFVFKDMVGEIYDERKQDTTILTTPIKYLDTYWKQNPQMHYNTKSQRWQLEMTHEIIIPRAAVKVCMKLTNIIKKKMRHDDRYAADVKLPSQVQQRIQSYHSATNEIPGHIRSSWRPSKAEKNFRMIGGLKRQTEKLKELLTIVESSGGNPGKCEQVKSNVAWNDPQQGYDEKSVISSSVFGNLCMQSSTSRADGYEGEALLSRFLYFIKLRWSDIYQGSLCSWMH